MIVDPRDGTQYRVVDAHTHWSRLVCRTTTRWPLKKLMYLLSIPELVDYITTTWGVSKRESPWKVKNGLRAHLFSKVQDLYCIDKCVVLPIFAFDNELVLEMADLLPERVVPFTNLNPRQFSSNQAKFERELKWFADSRTRGVKLAAHFQRFHFKVHAAGIERVFAWADESKPRRVVLFHTGSHSDIRDLTPLVKAFPELPVVLGHSGLAPQVDQALELAKQCQNVFLETSGQPYTYKLNEALRDPDIGARRILYGSDIPTLHPFVEQERILDLEASSEEKAMMFAGNVERLLETGRIP
ncbi:MAG: amidohydrolase family protein [Promethearchaeota archaeon]